MDIGVVGIGAVGLRWAQAVHEQGIARLALADPMPNEAAEEWAREHGIPLSTDVAAIGDTDVLLICVPGFAQPDLIDALVNRGGPSGAVVDFSTAPADAKFRASERLGVPYLDAAITGAVALSGVRTPLLVAGELAEAVHDLFGRLDTPFRHLEGAAAGDAVRVKLLRSVITKGIEALAWEALPAARHYGLLDQLFAALGDIDEKPFSALLRSMVQTHPAQAVRREVEVREAAAQLTAIGYPDALTRQVADAYGRTAARIDTDERPNGDGFDDALDWADASRVVIAHTEVGA
ncbi:DUF1932 domain-containing protein [Microbacterium forte]